MGKWSIIYGEYEGLESKAVALLAARMAETLKETIPCLKADCADERASSDTVIVGTRDDNAFIGKKFREIANGNEEGYIVCVEEQAGANIVYIAGNTARGVYYGTVDFLGEYLPTVAVSKALNFNLDGFFGAPFRDVMPAYMLESAPSVQHRAIWTWGHCIFNYKKFFENMSLLKLNEIVIWNDCMPVNASEAVAYAHGLGIRVIFGFSWGWDVNYEKFEIADCFKENKVREFAGQVTAFYEKNILPTGADGIYFQSFTETQSDTLRGIRISEAVVKWVNGIASEVLEKYPSLEIQFGLHATSVKDHLDDIAGVDERIKIVWEDCGSFPYHYSPAAVGDFAQTEEFTQKILTLRGKKEKFGAVFKGMTTLYWDVFKHIENPFVLGANSEKTLNDVYSDRLPAWKYIQAEWMKNVKYAKKITESIARKTKGNTDIQLLVEYGAFEKEIFFPVALAAKIMWQPSADVTELIEKTMLNPFVKFVNL